jgi:flagellar protein FliT
VSADNTNRSKLLSLYQALECASHEMLQAARDGDWDSVTRLEGACAVVIAKLRKMAGDHSLSRSEQDDRMRILRTIVANDAAIRRICDPLPPEIDPQGQAPGMDPRSFSVGEVSSALH